MRTHAVTSGDPHSPFHPESLFIDGAFFSSVANYVTHQQSADQAARFRRGMLAKYCQNIHLQKVFQQAGLRLVLDPPPPAAWGQDPYPWLAAQFRRCYDAHALSAYIPAEPQEAHADWVARVAYFHAAQPGAGRDRAAYLSRLWLDKRLYKKSYGFELEEEIACYEVT